MKELTSYNRVAGYLNKMFGSRLIISSSGSFAERLRRLRVENGMR